MDDYKVCGHTAIGKSHTDKGIKNQDYCFFKKSKKGFIAAAVADGLSSSKYSDVASRTAAECAVNYCLQHITNVKTILATIEAAFDEALFTIKQIAENSPEDYDTTLTLTIFINGFVYYGQIGDSGIIALREDGKFERVTEAQNGEGIGKDRPVYPLAAKSKWVFKRYNQKAKALFLATDGVLKKLEPPLLEEQEYKLNHKHLAYVFNNLRNQKNEEANSWIESEVSLMPPEEVDFDDKTLVVIISNKGLLKGQDREYYNHPTEELWESLKKKYNEALYPPSEPPPSEMIVEQPGKTGETSQPETPPQTEKGKQKISKKFWIFLAIEIIVALALLSILFGRILLGIS